MLHVRDMAESGEHCLHDSNTSRGENAIVVVPASSPTNMPEIRLQTDLHDCLAHLTGENWKFWVVSSSNRAPLGEGAQPGGSMPAMPKTPGLMTMGKVTARCRLLSRVRAGGRMMAVGVLVALDVAVGLPSANDATRGLKPAGSLGFMKG